MACIAKHVEERGGKKNFGCTSHRFLTSQMLAEEETAGASGAAVVLLCFGFGVAEFLFTFACYEDGAAIFEVSFN